MRWIAFLREDGRTFLPALAVGIAAPLLATMTRPAWRLETVSEATFASVGWLLETVGYEVAASATTKLLRSGDLLILIGPACSGVEGIALVSPFVTLYLVLFRHELRFPRALLLYPLGIAASAAFNILRITLLVAIGIKGNPELAKGAFHSHAGWLMFTIVALGLIALAQSFAAFRRGMGTAMPVASPMGPASSGMAVACAAGADPTARHREVRRRSLPPLRLDPQVARLLPFAVFMLSAVFASTVSTTPALLYPLRAAAMAAALVFF